MTIPYLELSGGAETLRPLMEDFYDRVYGDAMIGFYFLHADKERLIEKELELTLELLGADVPYTGRGMKEVHQPHGIFGGQFDRRLQILKETMADHNLHEEVIDLIVRHAESLRLIVIGGECK